MIEYANTFSAAEIRSDPSSRWFHVCVPSKAEAEADAVVAAFGTPHEIYWRETGTPSRFSIRRVPQ